MNLKKILSSFENKRKASGVKQICASDSHDFTRIYESDDGITYKCRECGLEATQLKCSPDFELDFMGSYIDNCSYKWKSEDMDASKVVKFKISFGDYPIHNIEYIGRFIGEEYGIRLKNTIDGSRDGGLRHPDGLFDPLFIVIPAVLNEKLFDTIKKVDFSHWKTSERTIENMRVGVCGFCVHDEIRLLFENGRNFVCYDCSDNGFNEITAVLKDICNIQDMQRHSVFVPESFERDDEKTILLDLWS